MNRDEVHKVEFWKDRLDEAKKYNKLHWSVYLANDSLWENLNAAHKKIFAELIPRDARVLDAGCGYGRWSEYFDSYVGVDFSPDFISTGKELYPDADLRVADLYKLPFEDKEFDWAFCVSIKHMIIGRRGYAEWSKMEKELLRVSKKVLILEYTNYDEYEVL